MAEAQEVRAEAERDRIIEALEANGYVVKRAAAALGIGKTTLGRRIQACGLDEFLEQKSRRVRRLRGTLEAQAAGLPPAPHERSRQAEDQESNRRAGLCGCGRPVEPLDNGNKGSMCTRCRTRERERKRATATARKAARAARKNKNLAA